MSKYVIYPDGRFDKIDELYHHGVKGQKWGVRRYQNKDGTLTASGKAHRKSFGKYGSDNDGASNRDHSKSDKSPAAWFATNAALHIIGLNPVGLASDVARLVQYGRGNSKLKQYNKELVGSEIDSKTGFHIKKRTMSVEEDASRVNPLVHNFDKNTKNNCMLCTCAYDLRRRGYDVRANKASIGYTTRDISAWYPKAKINKLNCLDDRGRYKTKYVVDKVKNELVKQGNGARGNLMITWMGLGGGHSVAYEISGGKLRIVDAQVNKVYDNPDKFLSRCSADVQYVRLDNVDFNKKTIREVAS